MQTQLFKNTRKFVTAECSRFFLFSSCERVTYFQLVMTGKTLEHKKYQKKPKRKQLFFISQPHAGDNCQKEPNLSETDVNRRCQSVVFNSGQKMAMRAWTYYYSTRHLLAATENNRLGASTIDNLNALNLQIDLCFR